MALTRKSQVAMLLEDIENTAETPTASDAMPVRPGISFTPSFGRVVRELAKDSLDPVLGTPGLRSATMSFVMDLQGSSDLDPTTAPPWSKPMRACGMREYAAKACSYASFGAGTVTQVGEAYSQAISLATGTVLGVFRGGDAVVVLLPDPGSAALVTSQLVTCATSGVTLTPTAIGDTYAYRPSSDKTSSIAITTINGSGFAVGDEIEQDQGGGVVARGRATVALAAAGTLEFEHFLGSAVFDDSADIDVVGTGGTDGGTPTVASSQSQLTTPSATLSFNADGHLWTMRGARGTFSIELRNGQPGAITFDFTGVMDQPADAAPFAFPGDGAVPPNVTGGAYALGDALGFLPALSQATIDIGNNVELRENANDASGYAGTVIGSRNPTASMDPEQVAEAVYPTLGNAWTQTAFRARFTVGVLANADGNAFQFYMPAAQYSDATPADRSGQRTLDESWALTGDNDESMFLYVI